MLSQDSAAFRGDPLSFLERAFREGGDVFSLPAGGICVAGPVLSRQVLRNADGLYREHSDFFATTAGTFGPRSAQVRMGRSARELLRCHMSDAAGSLADRVGRVLCPGAAWPDAGNRLLLAHFGAVLSHPGSSPVLRAVLGQVVERSVLAGARERGSRLSRARYRAWVMRVLAAEVKDRRRHLPARPADLLDVVVGAAAGDVPAVVLAEVYLGFVFAIVGSVGFALGWSVYLIADAGPAAGTELSWVVREALRLWPVAWYFGRWPARPHEIDGVRVTPATEVVVCSYLVHRHPLLWSHPQEFRPGRWASGAGHPAFLPFGWGPHSCAGASVAMTIIEDTLRILVSQFRLVMTTSGARPCMGSALEPPPFWLQLIG